MAATFRALLATKAPASFRRAMLVMRPLTCVSSRSSFALSIMKRYAHNWWRFCVLFGRAGHVDASFGASVQVEGPYVTWVAYEGT